MDGEKMTISPGDVGTLEILTGDKKPDLPRTDIYCVNCQKETPHTVETDKWGETVTQCDCGRALKFAKGADLPALIKIHKEHNT